MFGKVSCGLGLTLVFFLVVLATPSPATIIPGFSLSQTIEDSDVIAIGKIHIMAKVPATVVIQDLSYDATDDFANLEADRILKPSGQAPAALVPLHWAVPHSHFDGPMYADVQDGTYMLFFLKKRAGEEAYEFASPYYPGLPVPADAPLKDGTLEYQIVDQVCSFLELKDGDVREKSRLLNQLNHVSSPELTRTLYLLFKGPEPHLRVAALFALLTRKEAGLIPIAEQDILQNPNHALSWERGNLILAISQNFSASQSLPILEKALRSGEIEIRQTTAYALRSTGFEAVRPLLTAVDDRDSEVQWSAMQSLGEIVNQLEWRPRSNEPEELERCRDHWHQFAQSWSPRSDEPWIN